MMDQLLISLSETDQRRLTRETDDGFDMVRRRPYRLSEFDYFEEDGHAERGLDER